MQYMQVNTQTLPIQTVDLPSYLYDNGETVVEIPVILDIAFDEVNGECESFIIYTVETDEDTPKDITAYKPLLILDYEDIVDSINFVLSEENDQLTYNYGVSG